MQLPRSGTAPECSAIEAFKHAFLDNLFYTQGNFPALATQNDYYQALAHTVRDYLLQRWISTAAAYTRSGSRTACRPTPPTDPEAASRAGSNTWSPPTWTTCCLASSRD